MERAERMILLGLGMAFTGVLVPALWLMLALTLVTAGHRFVMVWRQASASAPKRAVADRPRNRWRGWRPSEGFQPRARRSDAAGALWRERTPPRRRRS